MISQKFSATQIVELSRKKKSDFWLKEGEKTSLELFHNAAQRVPAYKDFLKKNNIKPELIKTWSDFQSIPPVSKNNYLTQYSLKQLSWDGTLKKPFVFTATSGSTGTPFYFMREELLDWQVSIYLEDFIKSRITVNKPTLVVISFGMGIWIAGLITYKAVEMIAHRNNFPISIITPGINKKENINILKLLSPQFEQTIIIGYPPFIKDLIDEAEDQGINLKKLNIRLHFAAEAISEKFRDYVSTKAGVSNIYIDTINIYGSADIGAMAVENTTGILIKRIAQKNKLLFYDIFTKINKTPTLSQYNPQFINFEAPNNEILLTGNTATPLIRYAIGDHGGVFTYDEVISKLEKYGIHLKKEAEKLGISEHISQLPFVYVYERLNLSASFYGIVVYPEWLKPALLDRSIQEYLTGKFTLITKFDLEHNQYLEVNLELKKDKKMTKTEEKQILKKIIVSLRSNSSEYRELLDKLKQKAWPKLNFWPSEDPLHFQPGTKQKWVKAE